MYFSDVQGTNVFSEIGVFGWMEEREVQLCMGCMSPKFEEGKCSICGYDPDEPADLEYLPPKSWINDRFLVGKLVSSDVEGALYVGYDRKEEVRVWIREYAPACIIRRDHQTFDIQPLSSAEAQYKALMADFEDLSRCLQKVPEKVLPVMAMVYAHNTVYAVYRYIKTISLESFLQRSGGRLSWRHTKKLLMPLYHTVANIHKAGLIHRGLSPQTIHLDQSGTLWVSGFSIAAARTNKSEIGAALFDGYAAPEQYSSNSWQGTWTDIYALGAITYRSLSGEKPPCAQDRIYGDDLLDETEYQGIGENVVSAVNRAMAIEVEDRIQSAEALIAELLSTEGSNTAVYTSPAPRPQPDWPPETVGLPADRMEQELPSRQYEQKGGIALMPIPGQKEENRMERRSSTSQKSRRQRGKKERRAHPILSLFLSLLIATALLGGGFYWFTTHYLGDLLHPDLSAASSDAQASQGSEFSEDAQQLDDGKVPRFVGATKASVEGNTQVNQKYTLVYQEEYNSDYEAGVIYDQLPVEGTELEDGGEITLFVSKGIEYVEMLDVVGMELEEAQELLDAAGIQYDIIPVYNSTYEEGIVNRVDRQPGEQLNKNDDVVMLYTKMVDEEEEDEEEDEDDRSSSQKESSKSSSSSSEKPTLKLPTKQTRLGREYTVSYDDDGNEIMIFEN